MCVCVCVSVCVCVKHVPNFIRLTQRKNNQRQHRGSPLVRHTILTAPKLHIYEEAATPYKILTPSAEHQQCRSHITPPHRNKILKQKWIVQYEHTHFFFHWHYSPLWALACRTMFFHFFPICHQLSPYSHSHHLKISFYFLFPSFPGSSPSSRPFQFLSEDLFGHPIVLHSL